MADTDGLCPLCGEGPARLGWSRVFDSWACERCYKAGQATTAGVIDELGQAVRGFVRRALLTVRRGA